MVANTGERVPVRRWRRRIIFGTLVLLVCGALFFVFEQYSRGVRDWFSGRLSADRVAPEPRYYVQVDDILTKLNPTDDEVYINLSFVIEVSDRNTARVVESALPEVRDIVLLLLREMAPEELEGSAGTYRLREAIGYRINRIIEPNMVNGVYFQNIQIQ